MFTHYVAIDWSGARGEHHASIAIAVCTPGASMPRLIASPTSKGWSRMGALGYVESLVQAGAKPLVGLDFSFAPPFVDRESFFRFSSPARSAVAFWDYVNRASDAEADFCASGFVEGSVHRPEFYLGKRDGVKADYMRLRVCEQVFNAQGGGKPSSIFDAIGAAQVCKASFAGMRLLHHARALLPIWPMAASLDEVKARGAMVEIYTRLFIRLAGLSGNKVRTSEELQRALVSLGCRGKASRDVLSDHATDALIASAGLRALSVHESVWRPKWLTRKLAKTEGWTFGVSS
jgi:hypothetical protein